ncbi:MAG: peroxiredoxin-like family protein [Cognaticolwellia sp.]
MYLSLKKLSSILSLPIAISLTFASTTTFAAETINSYAEKTKQSMEKMQKKRTTWTAEDKAIMKAASDKLAKELPNPGLKAGNKAPNFRLKNAFGNTIELQQELAKGPVVLVFYRGAWCPYCNLHLHALQKNLAEFEKYGAQVIAITPQSPDKSAEQVKKDGFPFQVLSDSTSQVMKDYKLYFELPNDLMRIYKEHGLDIEEFNGAGRSGLPTPGAFIIDTKGIIRTMQAEVDYKSRMAPEAIIAALAKL